MLGGRRSGANYNGYVFDDPRGLRKKKGFTRTALRLMPYAAVVLLILLSIIAGFSMRRSSAKSRLLASTQAQLQTHTTELASIRGLVRHRDQALSDKTANLNKVAAELSTTKGALEEERAKLQRREEELLKARAEVEDAHEALKAEHKDVQARHSQASSEASSCTLQLADCRSREAGAAQAERQSKLLQEAARQKTATCLCREAVLLKQSKSLEEAEAELRRQLTSETSHHIVQEKQWQEAEAHLRMRVASLEDHHGDCVIANATQANATASNQTAPHSHDQEGSGHSHSQQEPAKKAERGGVLPGLGLDPVRDAAAAAKEAKEAAKEAAQEAAASADETANAAHPGATTGSFRSSFQKPIGGQWREKMLRARQGAKKHLELTPEDQVAEAEAAYAHLVDVLESHGISDAQGHAHMTKLLKRFLNARETMLEDHIADSSREGMSVVEKSRVERDASLAVDAALANVLMESGLRDIHGRQHMVRTLHSVLTEDEVGKSGTKEDPLPGAGAAELAPDPPKSSQQGRQFLNDDMPSPMPSQQVPVPPQEQRQSPPVNDNEQLIRL